jgi:selenocysteine-specific elongation factor
MKVADNRYFTPASLIELGEIARELHEASGGQFTASEFKDRSGIGRNLTIELLEFFDRAGLTRRTGQVRKVIATPEHVFDIAP